MATNPNLTLTFCFRNVTRKSEAIKLYAKNASI